MVIGVGIDVVQVERIERLLARRKVALARWFHPDEVAGLGNSVERGPRLAARFAAKEALIKACGGLHGGRLRDIALIRRPGQAARLSVGGPLGDWLLGERIGCWVSISHERQFAAAVVVLERRTEEVACNVADR